MINLRTAKALGLEVPRILFARAKVLFAAVHESGYVKLFGRRPHEGIAPRTGAGVRKAARDETARGERQAVQRLERELGA